MVMGCLTCSKGEGRKGAPLDRETEIQRETETAIGRETDRQRYREGKKEETYL